MCREHGVASATTYGQRQKYGGMDTSEAPQLKQAEDEKRRVKEPAMERSSLRYDPRVDGNASCYRRLPALLGRRGREVNIKRVCRLYVEGVANRHMVRILGVVDDRTRECWRWRLTLVSAQPACPACWIACSGKAASPRLFARTTGWSCIAAHAGLPRKARSNGFTYQSGRPCRMSR